MLCIIDNIILVINQLFLLKPTRYCCLRMNATFLNVLFNDTAKCYHYAASVVHEWTSMGHWWKRQTMQTEVLGEKPVPAPLCPPQSSHALSWDRKVASATGHRQLTRVSRGKAFMLHVPLMSSQTKLTYQHLGVSH